MAGGIPGKKPELLIKSGRKKLILKQRYIMAPYSIDIEKVFFNHLEKKGIEQDFIERFIKDLINSKFDDQNTTLNQVNSYLTSLGWDESLIDYHTIQLAKAYIENGSSMS